MPGTLAYVRPLSARTQNNQQGFAPGTFSMKQFIAVIRALWTPNHKRIGFLRSLSTMAVSMMSVIASPFAQTNSVFDGRPWNVGSGNLAVSFIQHSPIGAFPQTN
ncbi:MAG: hypothetical protein ABI766_14530 [Gemmatimonadales bacterium]